MYKKTTQIPNIVLDQYLRILSAAELKILLVILRQTNGWLDCRTGRRKTRDRISFTQFIEKTGYSRRMLSKAIQSLVSKGVITVTSATKQILNSATSRKGKNLYYTFQPVHFSTSTSALSQHQPVHQSAHNKTNYTKLTKTKGEVQSVGEVIANMASNPNYIPGYACGDFLAN